MLNGGSTWPLNEHKIPHFYNEQDIKMSSKNGEKSNYGLDLDLLNDPFK